MTISDQKLQTGQTVDGPDENEGVTRSDATIVAWIGGFLGLVVGATCVVILLAFVAPQDLIGVVISGVTGMLAGVAGGLLLGVLAGWRINALHHRAHVGRGRWTA